MYKLGFASVVVGVMLATPAFAVLGPVTGGSPAPLLASGIPSIIALFGAAVALRRR